MSRDTILLAGGGTGGHVFPLLAVARALANLMPELGVVFVGTDRGIESRVVPPAGFRLELLPTRPFRGGGMAGATRGLLSVARSFPRSRELLREHAPRAVLSIGGYAAVPIALAARWAGIPVALMEPNASPGLANRLVGPLARRVYTAAAETERHFAKRAVLRTGLALRPEFQPQPYEFSRLGQTLRVLVLGGSQGARSLNELVASALPQIDVPVEVTHQVGRGNLDDLRRRHPHLGRPAVALLEFIDDMAGALARSDLVISRAGAGAVAEICAIGRPSLLVPLPLSGDHQLHNARSVERAGAALCLPAAQTDAAALARHVTELARHPVRLSRMAAQARRLGRPHAAEEVARDLLGLAGIGTALSASSGPASTGGRGASLASTSERQV